MLCRTLEIEKRCMHLVLKKAFASEAKKYINWVFLGPPGVGKGTYSKIIASTLGIPQISTGDLIRKEIKEKTEMGKKVSSLVSSGSLLPDDMMLKILRDRLDYGKAKGEHGYILDGFPRTRNQAEKLLSFADISLVLNMKLREEALIEKCLGRRQCSKCQKDYNLADIHLAENGKHPEIIMPPMSPPNGCMKYMVQREDDTEDIVRKRLQVYESMANPVEGFFREHGLLVDFDVIGDINTTLPLLKKLLSNYTDDFAEASEMAA